MKESSNVEVVTTPTMAPILDPHFPEFNLNIPDQYRVDYWLPRFQKQLDTNTVPALTLMWIMCDHTSGGSSGFPVPTAQQADNDYAVGRIVEAISNSKIWGQSAIFIEEDDAQNGVDHVDGHRSPAMVVSPYAVQYAPKADGTHLHGAEHRPHDRADPRPDATKLSSTSWPRRCARRSPTRRT